MGLHYIKKYFPLSRGRIRGPLRNFRSPFTVTFTVYICLFISYASNPIWGAIPGWTQGAVVLQRWGCGSGSDTSSPGCGLPRHWRRPKRGLLLDIQTHMLIHMLTTQRLGSQFPLSLICNPYCKLAQEQELLKLPLWCHELGWGEFSPCRIEKKNRNHRFIGSLEENANSNSVRGQFLQNFETKLFLKIITKSDLFFLISYCTAVGIVPIKPHEIEDINTFIR